MAASSSSSASSSDALDDDDAWGSGAALRFFLSRLRRFAARLAAFLSLFFCCLAARFARFDCEPSSLLRSSRALVVALSF